MIIEQTLLIIILYIAFNNYIIKPLDNASNGKLVYHTMSSVYLRDMQTVITSATKVDSTKRSRAEGDGYKIDITSSGTLKADDSYDGVPTELDKFALYVEIPKLLTIDQRLTNISISDCSGTDILGEAVDHSAFEQNVSYRLITYSDGTRVIAAEFDFSAAPLDISKLTSLNLNIPAEIQYNDFRTSSTKSFTVKSYTKLNGNGVGNVIAKNGSTTDTRDFDGNNITDEVMALSSAGKSYITVAEDWRDTVEKFVKSYRDETWNYQADSTTSKWVSETTVNAYSDKLDENANLRATYQYRVSFDMGLPTKDIIFSDVLENANETKWHGKLKSLDFSYALSIGLKPTVYYSDDETKEYSETPVDNSNIAEYISNLDGFTYGGEVTGSIWTAPDENIRSFVVKFDTSSVPGGYVRSRQVYFYINMQAPDDKDITRGENTIYGKYAVNEHKVFYTSQTSVNYQRMELKASIAKVKLLPPVSLLTMLKVDGEDNKPLIGAEYTFYTDENATNNVRDWEGNITAANIPSDKFGEIIVDTLEPGTYYYKETKAPIGYRIDDTIYTITLGGEGNKADKVYKANFYVTVGPYQVTETQRVIYRTDSSNSCVFPNGKKRYSVNTVYYNDNAAGTAKTAVSGKYIVPEMIDQQRYLTNWVIVSGIEDDIGTKLAPTEQAITEYLAKHYADDAGGLRELEVRAVVGDPIYNFEYKGEVEVFTAPKDGIYYLEGWGAQGGDSVTGRDTNFPTGVTVTNFNELIKETEGGRGGYSYGYVYLHEGDEVYIAVGGKGNTRSYNVLLTGNTEIGTNDGGYNGGGSTNNIDHSGFWYNGSGGGATHFAINSNRGTLSAYKDNTDDILLVAGGGGGSAYYLNQSGGKHTGMGGYGGGEIGGSNHDNTSPTSLPVVKTATGGTQTTGGTGVKRDNTTPVTNGSFGQGGNGATHSWGSGGGGGWYGGGSSALQGGGGGSGHVNESALITGATIGGNETFFAPGGTQETGHTGAGYARITLVSDNKFNLQYSQTVNQFTAPFSGYYKLEGWGAAGGAAGTDDDNYKYTGNYHSVATEYYGAEGGRGGYSEGYIYLKAGDKIYYAVGGMGKTQIRYDKTEVVKYDHSGGFNGGGDSTLYNPGATESTYSYNAGGGGATHFALTKTSDGLLKNYSSSQSDVLLVAGGGGGSAFIEYANQIWYHYGHGGAGGGLEGGSVYNNASFNNSTIKVTGGTQTTYGKEYINETQKANGNGAFGQGGSNGEQCQGFTGRASGGGGGWYGGGSSGFQGGGGGSSYLGTNASIDVINASTIAGNTVDYTTTDGKVMSPEHMPTFKGAITDNGVYGITSTAETMIGNRGNGYARITYIPYTESIDYTCVEKVQSFTAPVEGIYKLEAWGASGGDAKQTQDASIGILKGGRGGYSYGNVYLTAGQTIYLAVGGEGESIAFRVNGVPQTTYSTLQRGRGYNGGGDAYLYSTDTYKYAGGGGGATHFALTKQGKGVLSDYEAVKDTDVLLVAGGGGGALYCSGSSWLYAAYGGYGGGVNGGSGKVTDSKDENIKNKEIPGGTQEQQTNYGNYTFGTFGQGTNATSSSIADGGGGGGWYGGAKGNDVNKSMSGGGGSGHCNGDELMSDYGYDTIGGNESFIAPDGESETGHAGDGYARVTFVEFPKVYDYDYTGSVRTFTAPVKGKYKLEAWGAQGGGSIDTEIHSPISNVSDLIDNEKYHTVEGGRGGYSTGVISLEAGETVYITVGGEGSKFEQLDHNVVRAVTVAGGYNGGGDTHFAHNSHRMSIGSGGGATHFALSDGVLSSLSNNKESVLLVAGGGGGSAFSLSYGSSGEWINQGAGGYGGGETGGNSIKGDDLGTNNDRTVATGGTQSRGGAGGSGINNAAGGFGYGGTANDYGTGGGGGWYGGGASRIQGGAGGSGYVKSSLSSGKTIAGDENTVFLAPNGSTETGHAGNGYARITRIG